MNLFGVNFDPTPGFNLSKKAGIAATGTTQPLGTGTIKAVTPSFSAPNGKLQVGSSNPSYGSPSAKSAAGTVPVSSGGGGQVKGATTTRTAPNLGGSGFADPFAAARSAFSSNMGNVMGTIRTNAMDAFGSGARNLRGQAEGLFNTLKQGQSGIDRSRENVEMNRLGGMDDILSFVRNGLKSGANKLSNMNALDSSASRAVAEAYGGEGNSRSRKVNNQAFLEGRDLDTQQEQLELQKGQGRTDFARTRDDMVSTIGQQVRGQLADLEAKAAEVGASGPQVEAERQRIIDEGIGSLNEIDGWLQSQLGGVNAQDTATTKKNAVALRQGGGGEATPFDFGEFSSSLQGGPAIDQLPLFTRRRDQQ